MKRYVLIAGVNGAGKSTLYQAIDELKDMERVNTDEIVREFGRWNCAKDVAEAGKIALSRIEQYFEDGNSFNQETTLCGRNIRNNIKKAKQLGYTIELHYVGVESVDIAKARIAYRVQHGGHGIPDKDVDRRYVESLNSLKELYSEFDIVMLYDNTDVFNCFARYKKGRLISVLKSVPQWYKLLGI